MTSDSSQIVCGTDFSVHAAEAGTVAASLSALWKIPVLLAHVEPEAGIEPVAAEVKQAASQSARARLHDEAERLRRLGADVKEELLRGSPYERLVESARATPTRLLVVSSVGKIAPSRWFLGSVAERIAESSSVPTLITRSAEPFQKWREGKRPLKVLVAVDFSLSSDAALFWVRELKTHGPVEITAAHVDWPPEERKRLGLTGPMSLTENPPELQRLLERNLQAKVQSVFQKDPIKTIVRAGFGRVDSDLIEIAKEENADILVVGTHQRHGVARFFLGSVSRGILHHAPMNVVCVPNLPESFPKKTPIPDFSRVLVATDLSPAANRALPFAYSALCAGGEVCLVHIASPQKPPAAGLAQELETLLPADAATRATRTEIRILEHNDPAQAICEEAERFGATLICLASHGRSNVATALMGSVAQAVLRKTKRPVLIIPLQL